MLLRLIADLRQRWLQATEAAALRAEVIQLRSDLDHGWREFYARMPPGSGLAEILVCSLFKQWMAFARGLRGIGACLTPRSSR